MSLVLLVALLSARQIPAMPGLDKRITFAIRAARAAVVIPELGKLAGIDLRATPQTENEVLIVSVADVPLSDVLARVATATSGQWKRDGKTLKLFASDKMRSVEERTDFAKRLADIKQAIGERVEVAKKQELNRAKQSKKTEAAKSDTNELDRYSGELEKQDFKGDAEVLITSLLQCVDPAVLARFEPAERLVFSTNPTRMQKAMSGTAAEVIDNFVKDHDAKAISPPADFDDFLKALDQDQADHWRTSARRAGRIGQVAKALFIESEPDFSYSVAHDFEVRLYDSKGGMVYSTSDLVGVNNQMYPGPAPDAKTSTPIVYSDDSKLLMKGIKNQDQQFQLSKDLKRKMCHPLDFDPLSFIQTDELMAYAKWKGKPFVADVPDEFGSALLEGTEEPAETLEAVDFKIKRADELVTVDDNDFTVLKSSNPVRSRSLRLDRMALSTLLQASEQKGATSLDDLATYALQTLEPRTATLSQSYLKLLVTGFDGMFDSPNWTMLRFYGQLDPGARESLAEGMKLPISSLSAGPKTCLEDLIYGPSGRLVIDESSSKGGEQVPAWLESMMPAVPVNDYRVEPTERRSAQSALPKNSERGGMNIWR